MPDNEGIKNYQGIPSEIFTDALTNAISTMTGFEVTPNATYIEETEENKDIIGSIILFGEKKLLLALIASSDTAALLVTYMTGMAIEDLTEAILCDGITEFVNIIGGSARAALENSNYRFVLTVPFTIIGNDVKILVKKSVDKYFTSFNSNEIELQLKIFQL